MCLISLHSFPKIAWKPIVAYKRLCVTPTSTRYFTPYRGIHVELGSTMRADHFLPMATTRYPSISNTKRWVIEHAIHAYWDFDFAKYNRLIDEIIVEAVVPRFSLYWANISGEICSNRLKLTKKIVYGKV